MDSTTVAVGKAFFNAAGALIPGDRQEKGHREQGLRAPRKAAVASASRRACRDGD